MNSFDVIKSVRISEKSTLKSEKLNQFTMVADRRATAPQIKRAVEELFNVKVVRVNTLNVRGKFRRQSTKAAGQAADWKKAIVTLKDGDTISLH
ncbi:MAG TPA: 50S ribosomal protein L23 [Candidatus Limnocylindria bacterium]|jgi:large subunit ribosomal protein L23|nr:50S ribosomal protein L23 [Candidatus Limnocylindria bacterium]